MLDMEASILAKLKDKARASNISYQQCLQLFFQEEFLRRLAKSPYANNFILKGGLFIYTLTYFQSRATVDIDFLLQYLSNEASQVDKIIAEIISIPTGLNDIVFLEAGKTAPIAIQMKYQGLSTQIIGRIKKVRLPFNVDIGIGDVVIPKPEKRAIKTQLEGFDAPQILTYSLESTIAEKFEAMLQRFELTSRMKDFYDIYYIARTFDFEGQQLREAIFKTMQNRGRSFNQNIFIAIEGLTSVEIMKTRWRAFLKRIRTPDLDFNDVLNVIQVFLRPVLESILEDRKCIKHWSCDKQAWKEPV